MQLQLITVSTEIEYSLPQKNCKALFCTNTFSPVCVLLGDFRTSLQDVKKFKKFVQLHPEVWEKSVREQFQFLHLAVKLPSPWFTLYSVHGMHPPHSAWKLRHLISEEQLVNCTNNEQNFPLFTLHPWLPPGILYPTSDMPESHFLQIFSM